MKVAELVRFWRQKPQRCYPCANIFVECSVLNNRGQNTEKDSQMPSYRDPTSKKKPTKKVTPSAAKHSQRYDGARSSFGAGFHLHAGTHSHAGNFLLFLVG